jgi:uncharacterized protein YbaA (DUF1428 family)
MISPVPVVNKQAYRAAAQAQAPLLIEQGALWSGPRFTGQSAVGFRH